MAQVLLKKRLQITVQGAVQGVGFRPFVYRLATELGLTGWVNNSAQGVLIEVEGQSFQLDTFMLRLEREKPPRSFIESLHAAWLAPLGYRSFEIRPSTSGAKTALILPDIASCSECLQEIFDPNNRRYRYPFANCTNCGPRFSIIEGLPYDRPQTTMKQFQMCDRCQAEYDNPLDRRFHAQPNACPDCGPQLELWSRQGQRLASRNEALLMAAQGIRQGKIVAIKGLGGFHLVVDAGNPEAVNQLRERKGRPEKPLALMYPSLDLVEAHCHVSPLEARLLRSPQAPIVLLRKRFGELYEAVAPGNPDFGIMLPYTPLHHLLMAELGFPIVATSGNLTNEPICTDEQEALQRLGGIADLFLVHDRPIARSVDDSVVRVTLGQETLLRRARGYAPLPISLTQTQLPQTPILAVGAHLKNAIALAVEGQVFISQHIGDLETVPAFEAFQKTIRDFQKLYELAPAAIATDAHPHYLSTQFAQQLGSTIAVQHHYAHVLSCMAENGLIGSDRYPQILGIAWDGTGYGLDRTIWGGEFLNLTETSFERVATLRPFPLPGGDKAIKEPRRIAIGLLYELFGDKFELKLSPVQAFTRQELEVLKTMLRRNLNAPMASSAGRLFDAVASLIGICQKTTYEGQAAMALEFAISGFQTEQRYEFELLNPVDANRSLLVIDWASTIRGILSDLDQGLPTREIATKFHNTLVEMIVATAKSVRKEHVVLSGGCFQNQYLTEQAIQRLKEENFHPYWHRQVPCNDGGIALGQIMSVFRKNNRGGKSICV